MKRVLIISVSTVLATSAVALPQPSELRSLMPKAEMVGQGKAKFLGRTVYDISLWSNEKEQFSQAKPFALAITYNTNLSGDFLASVSADEIARIEKADKSDFASLKGKLEQCFRDVGKGDRITGFSTGSTTAKFFLNGKQTCSISYPNLRQRFFGIWLSSGTRDAELRANLLGQR